MAPPNIEPDIRELQLSLALLLYDGFTGAQELVGDITVSFANKPRTRPFLPFRKTPQSTFLFFGLAAGAYTVQIRSNDELPDQTPPYYLPTDVSVSVADLPVNVAAQKPIWPAFPDINLANGNKPLDDPTQPEAYQVQRRAATLQPTAAYPFPAGATLLRGTVRAGRQGAPLADAIVRRIPTNEGKAEQIAAKEDFDLEYRTASDGEFLLFFKHVSGVGRDILLRATHNQKAKDQRLTLRRGLTSVAQDIILEP
jgi:hypothetical protein